MVLEALNKSVQLPLFGAVTIGTIAVVGAALFLLFGRKRVSSRTITTRFRR